MIFLIVKISLEAGKRGLKQFENGDIPGVFHPFEPDVNWSINVAVSTKLPYEWNFLLFSLLAGAGMQITWALNPLSSLVT